MENMEKELEERELMNENENREFYVYVHIRLDNNTVFYVGKGKGNRAYDLDRNDFHNGVCKKYGCRVEIIKDNLTESQAFRLESKMIKYYVLTLGYGAPIDGYRDFDHNLPYLTNCTWGGEGTSGMHHSKEVKQKIGEANKEKNKGKKFSEEHKKNLSESHKGKNAGKNHYLYGKHHSEETKLKMSKKVICVTTGEIFNSQTCASNYYNVAQCSISYCCREKLKSAGKLNGMRLKWKYVEDYNNDFKGILINPIIE